MGTALSARRTWAAPPPARLNTATVSMPRSRAARTIRSAISPRLAIRSRFMCSCAVLDDGDRLAGAHLLVCLDQELDHRPGHAGIDRMEVLHDLDEADGVVR